MEAGSLKLEDRSREEEIKNELGKFNSMELIEENISQMIFTSDSGLRISD
jgi:hypothetical protein